MYEGDFAVFFIATPLKKIPFRYLYYRQAPAACQEGMAAFLLEESALEDTTSLKITHEKIASHMGTAREVVTRMLRYFQGEGMVKLTRGTVELTDVAALRKLNDA